MYVVINIVPGNMLTELLSFLTQQAITFSVTDELTKLCVGKGNNTENSTQTNELETLLPLKIAKLVDSLPCTTTSPSETATSSLSLPLTPPAISMMPQLNGGGKKRKKPDDWNVESEVLKILHQADMGSATSSSSAASSARSIKEEVEEGSAEDEMCNEFVQNQLLQALFPNAELSDDNQEINTLDDEDNLETESQAQAALVLSNTADAVPVRYKTTYMSTKRGICHVCNREISMITTHRRRHAITHLGFKTLRCAICFKFFSRQDLASTHFKKDHPAEELIPFEETMTNEDEQRLKKMMRECFPEENVVPRRHTSQKSQK